MDLKLCWQQLSSENELVWSEADVEDGPDMDCSGKFEAAVYCGLLFVFCLLTSECLSAVMFYFSLLLTLVS